MKKTYQPQRLVWFIITLVFGYGLSAQDSPQRSREEVRAAVQGICPVSGLELGAHGAPMKVKIGEQELFICCEACKNGSVKKEHWTRIHQNFASAQARCFVMDNPLPKKPKWVIVKGQLIYVCCPPCIEKIEASPDSFIEQLNQAYVNHLSESE